MTFVLTSARLSNTPGAIPLVPAARFSDTHVLRPTLTAGDHRIIPVRGSEISIDPITPGDIDLLRRFRRPTDRLVQEIDVSRGLAQLVNKAPDGDTIKILLSDGRLVAVRYVNVDANETHFQGMGQGEGADAQTDANLTALGIQGWNWAPHRAHLLSVTPEDLAVRLLVLGTDQYGRLLGIPLRPNSGVDDIREGAINPDSEDFARLIKASVNHYLAETGMAHVTFYEGVSTAELALFLSATHLAQNNKTGIWKPGFDKTYTGFYVRSLRDIQGDSSIHPVIFRRLVSFMKARRDFDGPAFIAYLRDNPDMLRRIKPEFRDGDLEKVRGKSLDELLEPGQIALHDLIELMETDATRGGKLRVTERLEHVVRF